MSEAITRTTQLPEIIEPVEEIEEEEEIEYRKPRDHLERDIETEFCRHLTEQGYQYERQKRVANGIIDIFVYDKIPWIVEVKKSPAPFYLYQAIAQLKIYETCFASASLHLVTPRFVERKYIDILNQFKIELWSKGALP